MNKLNLIRVAVALLCFTPMALAADLVRIGNPLPGFYRNPNEKRAVYQMALYEGKLYIAHGGTDAKEQNFAVYLDPKTWKFGRDLGPDGKPVQIDAEEIRWVRVFGNDLHFANYDPVRGDRGAYQYRKRAGVWEPIKIGPDGHHRDFFRFDDKLLMFDGSAEKLPFPGMRWSTDDGKTWSPLDLSSLYSKPFRPGWEFFTFKGRLYAGFMAGKIVLPEGLKGKPGVDDRSDSPMLLVYTGAADRPFDIAYASTKAMFGADDYQLITRATEIADRLVFVSVGRIYSASSLAPDETRLHPVQLPENTVAIDIFRDGRVVYVLTRTGGYGATDPAPTYTVLQSQDGERFQPAIQFASPGDDARNCTAIAVVGRQLVAAFEGGSFFRAELGPVE